MALRVPSKLLRWFGERFFGSLVRQVADGKYGLQLRALYWGCAGRKTAISIALGVGAFCALGLGLDPELAETFGWAAGLLASVGLLDKAVRSAGRPKWLTDSGAYRLATEYAGTLAAVLSAGLTWTISSACHPLVAWSISLECATQGTVLTGVILVLVYLGILDGAMLARAPIPPIARRRIDELHPWGPGRGGSAVLALLSLLLLSGCASMGGAQAAIGVRVPKGVDGATLEGLVCRGEMEAAQVYAQDRGASRAEVTEALERARRATKGTPGCCTAEGKCGGSN